MILLVGFTIGVVGITWAGYSMLSDPPEKTIKKTEEPYSKLMWYSEKLREIPHFDIRVKAYNLSVVLSEYAKIKKQVTTLKSRRLVNQDIVAAVKVLDIAYQNEEFSKASLPTIAKLLESITNNILQVAAKNTENRQSLIELEMEIININKER